MAGIVFDVRSIGIGPSRSHTVGTQSLAALRTLAPRYLERRQVRTPVTDLTLRQAEQLWRPPATRNQQVTDVPGADGKSTKTTVWWPTWEGELSDFVATFLRYDLADRGIVVNREAEITRPCLNGSRTDIRIQAAAPQGPAEPDPLTVMVETKGCWNPELPTGLAVQLVDKYLMHPGQHAGIYLIGYFDDPARCRDSHAQPGRKHGPHTSGRSSPHDNRSPSVNERRSPSASFPSCSTAACPPPLPVRPARGLRQSILDAQVEGSRPSCQSRRARPPGPDAPRSREQVDGKGTAESVSDPARMHMTARWLKSIT
jgi:hypothetical protein